MEPCSASGLDAALAAMAASDPNTNFSYTCDGVPQLETVWTWGTLTDPGEPPMPQITGGSDGPLGGGGPPGGQVEPGAPLGSPGAPSPRAVCWLHGGAFALALAEDAGTLAGIGLAAKAARAGTMLGVRDAFGSRSRCRRGP